MALANLLVAQAVILGAEDDRESIGGGGKGEFAGRLAQRADFAPIGARASGSADSKRAIMNCLKQAGEEAGALEQVAGVDGHYLRGGKVPIARGDHAKVAETHILEGASG